MPEFVVDLVGCGDGLCDLGAETVLEPLAESLNGLLDRLLSQIELRRDLAQRERVLVAPDIILEQVEERSATRGRVFGAEAAQGMLDLQQRPALVKDRVGRSRVVGGFQGVAFLRIELIKGEDRLAATPLEGSGALMFVREEMLERCQ